MKRSNHLQAILVFHPPVARDPALAVPDTMFRARRPLALAIHGMAVAGRIPNLHHP
jgi:hypothetical protein